MSNGKNAEKFRKKISKDKNVERWKSRKIKSRNEKRSKNENVEYIKKGDTTVEPATVEPPDSWAFHM